MSIEHETDTKYVRDQQGVDRLLNQDFDVVMHVCVSALSLASDTGNFLIMYFSIASTLTHNRVLYNIGVTRKRRQSMACCMADRFHWCKDEPTGYLNEEGKESCIFHAPKGPQFNKEVQHLA